MANPVVHLELHTHDRAGACALLSGLCGWRPERIEAGGGAYWALETGRGPGSGVVQCQTPRPLWLAYVAVGDVSRATERARDLGAAVLLEPRDGPAGRRSVVSSPAVGDLAFWQPRRDL